MKIYILLLLSVLISAPIKSMSSITSTSQQITNQWLPESVWLQQFMNWSNTVYKQIQYYLSPTVKSNFNTNPYKNITAYVNQSAALVAGEEQYLKKRTPFIQKSLQSFLGTNFSQPLTIGFCGTGGGYRAMILTSGYLAALEKMGLLNALSYIATLSGSTWLLAPWIMTDDSIVQYQARLEQKIERNTFELSPQLFQQKDFNILSFVNQIVWPKFLFNQPLSAIDWYGALLSYIFFSDGDSTFPIRYLTQQQQSIVSGQKPFPIYTAVSMHKMDEGRAAYNWYEFNPFEVRNIENNFSVPAYAFGSEFDKGRSVEIAPEQTLGFLLAICGSAFSANVKDILGVLLKRTETELQKMSDVEKFQYTLMKQVVDIIEKNVYQIFSTLRMFAAQLNNPFRGMANVDTWLKNRQFLTFVDAGVVNNIPLKSLLRPERKLNLIIIGESSGDADNLRELTKALQEAEAFDYHYSRVDDGTSSTVHFYKDLKNTQAPRLVYINFFKDPQLLAQASYTAELADLLKSNKLDQFDPTLCIQEKFCGTFNFVYTQEGFRQLAGMAEYNMLALKQRLSDFIKKEFFK